MINLFYPLKLEAFSWDTNVCDFLAEILQGDFQLVLDTFELKRPSHYVELYVKQSDGLMRAVNAQVV